MVKREYLPTFLARLLFAFFFFSTFAFSSTLYLSIDTNPSRLNPILASDAGSAEIADKLFDGLIKYDKNASIIPSLAKSYYFEDNKTLIFKLRNDVFWQDGEKFSAKDVVFTYKAITSPKLFSPYSSSYQHVKNVEALDDLTVKVTYKEPYFRALESWMIGIIPEHLLADEKNLMTSSFNLHPVGTGPYKLKSLTISSGITLEANENYYEGAPKIKEIAYRFTPDPASQFMLLKKGEIDIGGLSPLQYKRQLELSFTDSFNIHRMPGRNYGYMGFNLKRDKFKDKEIRKALAMLIDRQKIIDIMAFGFAKPVNGPFLEGGLGYNPDVHYPKFDPKKAKAVLKKHGFDEKHPFAFEIVVPSAGSGKQIAQIIQYMLMQAGVKVTIKAIEWQAFLNTVIEPRDFDAVIMAWSTAIFPNPETIWYSKSDKKGGFNFVGYNNPTVDKLIEEVLVTVDTKELDRKLQEIYKLVSDDYPYIFLYATESITATSKKIKHIEPSIIGIEHNLIKWEKF